MSKIHEETWMHADTRGTEPIDPWEAAADCASTFYEATKKNQTLASFNQIVNLEK